MNLAITNKVKPVKQWQLGSSTIANENQCVSITQ